MLFAKRFSDSALRMRKRRITTADRSICFTNGQLFVKQDLKALHRTPLRNVKTHEARIIHLTSITISIIYPFYHNTPNHYFSYSTHVPTTMLSSSALYPNLCDKIVVWCEEIKLLIYLIYFKPKIWSIFYLKYCLETSQYNETFQTHSVLISLSREIFQH